VAKPPTRVFIGDSDAHYRRHLVEEVGAARDFEVVGEAGTGQEATERMRLLDPEVALLELEAPQFDGTRLTNAAVRSRLATRTLLLFHTSPAGGVVHEALKAGARGLISKSSDAAAILEAVAAVARGEVVLGTREQTALGDEIGQRKEVDPPGLTEREREVLTLAAEGFTTEYIANSINLSSATVKTYLSRIYRKLGVLNKAAAVAEAIRNGWLQIAIACLLWEPTDFI
jgi:two-component system nitrate/nitrite response regulator NarL